MNWVGNRKDRLTMTENELQKLYEKHKEHLIDAPWIMGILIMLTFKNNYTYDEFDTILTKLENGTLTKEEFLKKEMEINDNDV